MIIDMKFHMPSSSISLIIAIKQKAKEYFCTGAMFLQITLTKVVIFQKFIFNILGSKLNTASVSPTSQVCVPTMLILLTVGN